jgi:glycosyltransferase involved in cell wall biosynthesis/GT2 family glycosyltransferase
MAPVGLPAREALKLAGQTTVAWAVFDAAWYLATYADARAALGDADDAAVLQFYLSHGQQRGHSPNIWFDEAWHLLRHPGVASAVRDGHAESAFDTYCRTGFRTRSAHWLFNEALYRQRHPDLHDEVLARDGNANGYDHYLRHGAREGRIGHLLFEPQVYRAQLPADARCEADAVGAYRHYLARISQRRPEIRTSHCFDPVWYARRYPAVANGGWRCALHHYLTNETPTEFNPLPEFSESYYLQRNKDVAAAVEAKRRRNGYDHFLHHGAAELRSPCNAIDLRYYVGAHSSVRDDIDAGRARDAFVHYLAIGRAQGLPTAPPHEDHVTERQAAALYRRRAEQLLPLVSRTALDFRCEEPAVSILVVMHDAFPATLLMLAALRAGFAGEIELILIDAGAADGVPRIESFVPGARVLRYDGNVNLVRAVNAALSCASADCVMLIHAAVELAPGALGAALRRLRSDPRVGAIGGKLLRPHGRLESAGGIVWRNGAMAGYLRDASPLVPEANFVREVDYVSGPLLLRAALVQQLDGLDDELPLDGGATGDLCLRIAGAGFRVLYDPAIAATRLGQPEADTTPTDEARSALLRKHMDRLRFRYDRDRRVEVFARGTGNGRRVLFLEDTIPLRRLGSGFVRSNDLIHVMATLGYRITVYPINACKFDVATIYAEMPDTVEVMHDRACDRLAEFLSTRQGYYDAIWIARTHNVDRIRPMLEDVATGAATPPRVVLDIEAIASLREAERAALTDAGAFDVDAALMREFANAHLCQCIIAVNAHEAEKLHALGFSEVTVIGHWRDVQPTPRGFADRAGMLFLAAMHEPDSPHLDALDWFVDRVLPLVEQSLGWETRLTVAGYVGPEVSLDAYRDHPRITIRGPVEDVAPLYDAHRIVVAPTRYAAGVPYKVHEAASYGVPVITTELLRRQLGWQDERDLLAADVRDPAGFARRIVAVYRDPVLWQSLRDNALERIRQEHGRAAYEAAIRRVLEA